MAAARFHNLNSQAHIEKCNYSVVVHVEPNADPTMLPSICTYVNIQIIEKPYPASPLT